MAQELTLRTPHRVRRLVLASTMCGLGGVPGTPLAFAVLATRLRYYSPRFLRATARWVYGRVHDTDGTLMRHQNDSLQVGSKGSMPAATPHILSVRLRNRRPSTLGVRLDTVGTPPMYQRCTTPTVNSGEQQGTAGDLTGPLAR